MLRKISALLFLVFSLSSCCPAQAAAKYQEPIFTNCNLYQLGSEEFILKFSGRKLPEPEYEIINNSINITFHETKANNPEKINSMLDEIIEVSPVVYGFYVTCASEDNTFTTKVHIESNFPLELLSSSRAYDGYTMRIKAVSEDKTALTLPPKQKTSSTNSPVSRLPFRASAKITIAFRDADLQDVLRAFMEYLGRNMVLDASFPRDLKVTMSLNDVRVDEIINYLLRTYDLACYSYGPNITAFGTSSALYKLSGASKIKAFNISFAEAEKIREYLTSITGIEADEITLDERMRTLYVRTNPAKMQEVEEIISKLDVPQKQVMIRASIFEFNDTVTREVENALEAAYDEWTIQARRGLSINYYESRRGGTPSTLRTLTGVFAALEAKNKGKVLANPSVIAIDGEEAEIELTQTYVYSITKDDAGNSIPYTQEVGPTLTFTPKIERDGYIYLEIELETGDVVGSFNDSPITSNRSVTTKIRVQDGQPFVIGGLFQNNNSRTTSRIPVLGDIPLIGNLFTYRSGTKQRTQAVMIVTPYIIDNN